MAPRMYLKIDVGIPRNDKIRQVPPAAKWLYLSMLCHCMDRLSNGRVSLTNLPLICAEAQCRPSTIKCLESVGLVVRDGDAFVIPDWLDWNEDAATMSAKRQVNRDRMRKRRQSVQAHDHEHNPSDDEDTTGEATDDMTPCTFNDRAGGKDQDQEKEQTSLSSSTTERVWPEAKPDDEGDPSDTPAALVATALDLLARRDFDAHVERGGIVTAPQRFLASCRNNRERAHAKALHLAIHRYPSWSARQLADAVEAPDPTANRQQVPLDAMGAAQAALMGRSRRRAGGLACQRCDDAGFWLDDDDVAHPCDHPTSPDDGDPDA